MLYLKTFVVTQVKKMNNTIKKVILRFSIVLLTISGLLLFYQKIGSDGFGVCLAAVVLNVILCTVLIVSIKRKGDDNSYFSRTE